MMPMGTPQTAERLLSHDDESGRAQSWPVALPPQPRRPNYYLGCLPCVLLFFAPAAYVLSLPLAALAALGAFLAFVVCGCPYLSLWGYYRTWGWPNDTYVKILYQAYQSILDGRADPTAGPEFMPIEQLAPKNQLAKHPVDYALNLEVPQEAEEEFGYQASRESKLYQAIEEGVARKFPLTEDFEAFAPGEDPVKYVMDRLGSVYPPIYQEWNDKWSDHALTRLCLYGLGAHRVETATRDGQKLYVVRTNMLSGIEVRPGFARYGGDAYFDENWNVIEIDDMGYAEPKRDGKDKPTVTRPGDANWDEAKFRFRSSLSVLVTVVDHLYGTHLETSNLFVTAMREHLAPEHPVRRFLTPFTFQTISVNHRAKHHLVAPNAMSRRCFAWSDRGLHMAFAAAPKLLRSGMEVPPEEGGPLLNREKYVQWLANKGIDTEYFRQSLRLWNIMRNFVVGYLDFYYGSYKEVAGDKDVENMMRQFIFQAQYISASDIGKAFCSEDADAWEKANAGELIADMLTLFCFTVTGGHEQVGAVEVYVQDASFCAFKWVPGALVGTKQTAVAQALLMSFTSTVMPKLMGQDWTHLFPQRPKPLKGQPTAVEVFRRFQEELQAFSSDCDAYNTAAHTRLFPENSPLYVFNPKYLETSISV